MYSITLTLFLILRLFLCESTLFRTDASGSPLVLSFGNIKQFP